MLIRIVCHGLAVGVKRLLGQRGKGRVVKVLGLPEVYRLGPGTAKVW